MAIPISAFHLWQMFWGFAIPLHFTYFYIDFCFDDTELKYILHN